MRPKLNVKANQSINIYSQQSAERKRNIRF